MYLRPKELVRRHLEDALSDILVKPLIIMAAPTGYGKTTVVKAFINKHTEITPVWLPMGKTGVDEVWVWQKLCEAFGEYNGILGEQLRKLGLPETDRDQDEAIHIIRENIRELICLVFDDYHEYGGKMISKLIERLTYEEIHDFHILIISRIYPDIPYEEMFLKGYCILLDQQTLALTRKESEEIFRINDVMLTEEALDKMYEYTDGWIAAVYLALYDYKRSGRFENLTSIGRLLKTAIYDKLSGPMQELCMKLSILESFTLDEASDMLGREVSYLAISQMKEQFGFIEVNIASGTYTMHTLLKSVAYEELERSGIDKAALYRQCGRCRERKRSFIGALVCYRNAGAYEDCLKLLSEDMRNVIFEQAPGIVGDLFEKIPMALKMQYHLAYLGYIYYIIMKENAQKGQRLYEEIREQYELAYGKEGLGDEIRGELLIVEALLGFNDLEKMNTKLREAYGLLHNQPSCLFESSLLTQGTPFMTELYYNRSGSLLKTIELEKEYATWHMRLVGGRDEGWDDFLEAEYCLLTGDVAKAETLARRVGERASFGGVGCVVISSYYIRARCLIYQGKEQEFQATMEEWDRQMQHIRRPVLKTDYELAYSYIYACMGRFDKMPGWLRSFHLENCSRMVRNTRSGCVVYGTMLCRQKKWEKLDAVAEQILMPYESTSHIYILTFGYIFKAIAVMNEGEEEKAEGYLMKAVELAEPDGVVTPFIERGEDLIPLIEALSRKNRFCASLKMPIRVYMAGFKVFDRENVKVTLTPREEELMQLVKKGLRNSEISEKMNIALVTVEKNLTSIYRKLNVSNRAAAIARMEETYT